MHACIGDDVRTKLSEPLTGLLSRQTVLQTGMNYAYSGKPGFHEQHFLYCGDAIAAMGAGNGQVSDRSAGTAPLLQYLFAPASLRAFVQRALCFKSFVMRHLREYLARAREAGVRYADVAGMGEAEVEALLFKRPEPAVLRPMPDWAEVAAELRKPAVTLQLVWQEYRDRHADGYSYSQFRRHYRAHWKLDAEPRMRRTLLPAQLCEVDYAGMTMTVIAASGERQVSIFVGTLPFSTYIYAEATWTQGAEDWLGSHVRMFGAWGGSVPKLVPDNLKTGVTHASFYDPVLNRSYLELARHYGIGVVPARVRRPRDKPLAENGVQQVERWVLAPLRNRTFFSLDELNAAMAEKLSDLNARPLSADKTLTRAKLFEEREKPLLKGLRPSLS